MNQHSSSSSPDAAIAELVRKDQLQLLFKQSLFAVIGTYLALLILGWLLWNLGDHRKIAIWLGLSGIATLLRLGLIGSYYRAGHHYAPQRWELAYSLTMMLSATVWGFGALLVMPPDSLLAQTIILIFAVGLGGSAALAYSPYRMMTLSAIAVVLLPSILWLLFQPSSLQRGLALAAMLFTGSAVRTSAVLSDALTKAFHLSHEMELAHRIASRAAQTDALTGLSNRRAFYERGEQLFRYCMRNQRPLCAIVMDIDHFKRINDVHGHHAGDEVLRRIGELLHTMFRKADACGRLGGEEFAILLADIETDGALDVAEKVRRAVSSLEFTLQEGGSMRITASLGVAKAGSDLRTLMQQADKAMYQAKAGGRNCVATA